ncbi:Diguanylate cyclase [Candidatus Sulfotelmatomonas gaucii]|uniref:diguanylate cyclase n=1 Tax=Candidatus Sulfuritelmatomonas gaucii TaxID=2043161 RepID=A0A2N9M7E9_9BACT|nr:Diguanylate cyclase [Candidatus Sulfotelmatomonas gaucii]
MISLKRYLDGERVPPTGEEDLPETGILAVALAAYGSALMEMGNCSLEACPGLGDELKHCLRELQEGLVVTMSREAIQTTDKDAQVQLREWGRRTARHYREKAGEVRELLLTVARTAESVGARDQRCAGQMHAVTDRLQAIASLEDLTEIRASIEKSTAELKSSIQRMSEEGKAAVEELRKKVSDYEAKLEAAEELASRDALTKLRSRLYLESQIERHMAAPRRFCIAVADIDGFKKVNDQFGHVVGDEVLKQFAGELKSACRSTDIIGRWGGDEFLILLDCGLAEASAQTERVRKWVCGSYAISSPSGRIKLELNASIGLAERAPDEKMKELLSRADAAMYAQKDAARDGTRL